MIEYFALIIPIVGVIVSLKYFAKQIVWWEILIPLFACLAFIAVFKFSADKIMSSDTEYRGHLIQEARYYEYWETYVHKTCSRQVCSGSGKTKVCHTVYYDCSYCDHNPAKYIAYDNGKNEFTITKDKYLSLVNQWGKNQLFVELNRNITYWGSCGKDGDMYSTIWDGKVETSEGSVTTNSYENRVKASRSAFSYVKVEKEEAIQLGLHEYPELYDFYKQNVVLGLENVNLPLSEKLYVEKLFQYLNGYLGPKVKAKTYVLLFKDKPQTIALDQENYWVGGNENEFIICIGYNSADNTIDWVKPFSWTVERRLLVEVRENIMEIGKLDFTKIYSTLMVDIPTYFKPRDFENEFHHLSVEMPTWAIILLYFLTIGITVGTIYWAVTNEFVNK